MSNEKTLDLLDEGHEREALLNSFYPDLDSGLVIPRILVDKKDCNRGRVYYQRAAEKQDRVYFDSVTTILQALGKGAGYDMWLGNSLSYNHAMEYANKAAMVGNIVHAFIMYLIWGHEVDCDKGFYDVKERKVLPCGSNVRKRLLGFMKFMDEKKPETIATELSLYNNRTYRKDPLYPYAGQADYICRIDGKIWLIDWKTGKEYHDDHELQGTAYKMLWDSLYGKEHGYIDHIACCYLSDGWRKGPTYKLKEYKFQPEIWENLLEIYSYMFGKNGKLQEPKFRAKYQNKFILNNKEKDNV